MRAIVLIALLGASGCSVIDAISGSGGDDDDDDLVDDFDAGSCAGRTCYAPPSGPSIPAGNGSNVALGFFGASNRDLVVSSWQGQLYFYEHDADGAFTEIDPPVFFDLPVAGGIADIDAADVNDMPGDEVVTAVWTKDPNTTTVSIREPGAHEDVMFDGRSTIVEAMSLAHEPGDEIVVLTEDPHMVRVLRNDSTNGWVIDHEETLPAPPIDVASGHFDADECPDLAFLVAEGGGPPQIGVMLGTIPCDSEASFTAPTFFDVSSGARRIGTSNFTIGPQIVVAYECVGAACDAPWPLLETRDPDGGAFTAATVMHQGGGFEPGDLIIDDFDGDEQPDVALLNAPDASDGHDLIVLYGNNVGFTDENLIDMAGTGDNVIAGDFNGDGRLDFATVSFPGDVIIVLSQ